MVYAYYIISINPQVCDDRMDCDDGSDECQNCIQSPLSDDTRLIAHPAAITVLFIAGLYNVNITFFKFWYTHVNLWHISI